MATKLGTCSTQNTPDLPYVQTVQPGENVTVDSTDPRNPIVSSPGGGGGAGGINNQSGTSYTPVLTDNSKTIVTSTSSDFMLMVPTNASVPFPLDAKIGYTQGGSGLITVVGAPGVTIQAPFGTTTSEAYDGGVLQQVATDVWRLWTGASLGSMALVDDAPSDGNQYARQNAAWKQVISGGVLTGINTQTGTAYTLALTDATQAVEMTNTTANVVMIPLDASVDIPLYSRIPVIQGGTGATSISATSGVTLYSPDDIVSPGAQYALLTLMKLGVNEWLVIPQGAGGGGGSYTAGNGINISSSNVISSTLGSIALSGNPATYADLPTGLGTGDAGKAYLVQADGLIYIWSGTAFPANGDGISYIANGIIATQTFSAVSQMQILTPYPMVVARFDVPALTQSASANVLAQLQYNGTWATSGYYTTLGIGGSGNYNNQSSMYIATGVPASRYDALSLTVRNAQGTSPMQAYAYHGYNRSLAIMSGSPLTGPCTGIRIYASTGTVSGTINIYVG